MTRTLSLLVVAAVIACGVPLTETSQTVSATVPPAPTETTAAQSPSTSATTTTTKTPSTTVDHSADPDLVELELPQGIPVDAPEGFPSLEELIEAMAEPLFRPPPHPRARIFSGEMTGADPEELAAAGYDPNLWNAR